MMINKQLVAEIRSIHRQVKEIYGSPRMTAELRGRGFLCGENRIAKLMRKHNIKAKMERQYKPRAWSPNSLIRKNNLLEEYQGPTKVNEIWVADFTYVKVGNSHMYLSTIMDLYTRKIVGQNTSKKRNSNLVIKTIKMALKTNYGIPPKIFHSDRGIEYANYQVADILQEIGVEQSMSGKGCCYDNAHMESFFHSYKTEMVYHEVFSRFDEFKRKTENYIRFYNSSRLHSSLNYMSPNDFELRVS